MSYIVFDAKTRDMSHEGEQERIKTTRLKNELIIYTISFSFLIFNMYSVIKSIKEGILKFYC